MLKFKHIKLVVLLNNSCPLNIEMNSTVSPDWYDALDELSRRSLCGEGGQF